MQKFTFKIGADVRAYGNVTVEADTIQSAKEHLTHGFIEENFDHPKKNDEEWFDMDDLGRVHVFDVIDDDGEVVELYTDVPSEHEIFSQQKAAFYDDAHDLSPSEPFASSDMQPSNDARADWARQSLERMEDNTGCDFQDGESVRDLMVNLRHLCDQQGWDVEAMWAGSRQTYRQEIAEQPKAGSTS